MCSRNDRFAMGIETECLTAVPESPETYELAALRLIEALPKLTPTLPATVGVFTCYGKVYCDAGHIELAGIECDCPYLLSTVVEQLQTIVAAGVERLARDGINLVLANNNYSGLLQERCPVWGDHENYLTEVHPSEFTNEILPFLVTRIYAGAGAIYYPSGEFLAGARPTCMELVTGGGTTESRAIHSTAREEHHMGSRGHRFRYHGILADGHRSHFNLVLQYGASALALKAIIHDPKLRGQIGKLHREFGTDDWVGVLKRLNVLARPGEPLRIDPLIARVQRVYLDGARRYASSLSNPPRWIRPLLAAWDETLSAFERLDRAWLAPRLDAFAKYEFFTSILGEMGIGWQQLPRNRDAFHELTLLDQSYHEFCNPRSVFARLERAGVLKHRVHPRIEPGAEPDPYIPNTTTRARARSRFIRDHQDQRSLVVDWSWVHDPVAMKSQLLRRPHARRFSSWREDYNPLPSRASPITDPLSLALRECDQGAYETARQRLLQWEQRIRGTGAGLPFNALRCLARIEARSGDGGALVRMNSAYDRPDVVVESLGMAADYCGLYRFMNLPPDLTRMQPWIELGESFMARQPEAAQSDVAWIFKEHVAHAWIRNGHHERARQLLKPALPIDGLQLHVQARILCSLGEAYRLRGSGPLARQFLERARRIQVEHRLHGDLVDYTLPSLAKCGSSQPQALALLKRAKDMQAMAHNRVGYAVTLLLEARIRRDPQQADSVRGTIQDLCAAFPVLSRSPIIRNILDRWSDWVAGAELTPDPFWGL